MKNILLAASALLLTTVAAMAEDTATVKRPSFVVLQVSEGLVMPTSRITGDRRETPSVTALNFKYAIASRGDRWEDYYYGMPYKGIGIYKPFYSLSKEMGHPLSIYLFQGARLKEYGSRLSLNYEINIGVSFNWNYYDLERRPNFEALGSSVNAHLSGDLYLQRRLSDKLDMDFGLSLAHFSNGSQRSPNYGINSLQAFLGMKYHLHSRREQKIRVEPPEDFAKSRNHDISVFFTRRTVSLDTIDSGLRSKYPYRVFKVFGISYAYMFHNVRRFSFGPALDLVYDEGNFDGLRGEESPTGEYREIFAFRNVSERFNVGLSVKGEVAMSGYSIFGNLGFDIVHSDAESRFYQIYGVKAHLTKGLYASFSVRSTELTHSRFLCLNLGYTFSKVLK